MLRRGSGCILIAVAAMLIPARANAINLFWVGVLGDQDWFGPQNWTAGEFGIGPPQSGDRAFIANGDPVRITHDFAVSDQVDGLSITGGSRLYTSSTLSSPTGYEVIVNGTGGTGLTEIGGAGTQLVIREHQSGTGHDSFDTDLLTINAGATAVLENGRLEVDGVGGKLDINLGGTLRGYGWIDLESSHATTGVVLQNDGLIEAGPACSASGA